jgi:hypothetical protein
VEAEQPGTALTDAGIWLYSAMQVGTAGWIGTMRLVNSLLFKNSRSFGKLRGRVYTLHNYEECRRDPLNHLAHLIF